MKVKTFALLLTKLIGNRTQWFTLQTNPLQSLEPLSPRWDGPRRGKPPPPNPHLLLIASAQFLL